MTKGSTPRSISISQQEYDTRWDAIFQRDLKEENINEKDPVMEDYQKKVQQQFFEDASCTGGTLKK
jgi:hypothetical protein